MKHIGKRVLLNAVALAIVAAVAPGLDYGGNIRNLILIALVLGLAHAVLKPFLKILLLPLSVITLGIVGWFMDAIILYLVTLVVPLSVDAFSLFIAGHTFILSRLLAFIVISFLLNSIGSIIAWLLD